MPDKLENYKKEGYNILCPMTKIDEMPSWNMIVYDFEQLSPDPADGDIFPKKGGKKDSQGNATEFCLHAAAIKKLGVCARVEWDYRETGLVPQKTENLIVFVTVGEIKKADGQKVGYQGHGSVDMLIEEDKIRIAWQSKLESTAKTLQWLKKKSKSFIDMEIRKEINLKKTNSRKIAETGAQVRVLIPLLKIHPSYTLEEIKHQFVAPSVTVNPNDPVIKEITMRQFELSLSSVYNITQLPQKQRVLLKAPAIDIPEGDFQTVPDQEPESSIPDEFEDKEGAKKAVDKLKKTADQREASKLASVEEKNVRDQKIADIETEAKRTGFNLVTGIKKPLSEFMDIHLDALLEKLKKDPNDDIP